MEYILIIFMLGFSGRAADSITFNDKASCEQAASMIKENLKPHASFIIGCVSKGPRP